MCPETKRAAIAAQSEEAKLTMPKASNVLADFCKTNNIRLDAMMPEIPMLQRLVNKANKMEGDKAENLNTLLGQYFLSKIDMAKKEGNYNFLDRLTQSPSESRVRNERWIKEGSDHPRMKALAGIEKTIMERLPATYFPEELDRLATEGRRQTGEKDTEGLISTVKRMTVIQAAYAERDPEAAKAYESVVKNFGLSAGNLVLSRTTDTIGDAEQFYMKSSYLHDLKKARESGYSRMDEFLVSAQKDTVTLDEMEKKGQLDDGQKTRLADYHKRLDRLEEFKKAPEAQQRLIAYSAMSKDELQREKEYWDGRLAQAQKRFEADSAKIKDPKAAKALAENFKSQTEDIKRITEDVQSAIDRRGKTA